jgi:hypothetical protein
MIISTLFSILLLIQFLFPSKVKSK